MWRGMRNWKKAGYTGAWVIIGIMGCYLLCRGISLASADKNGAGASRVMAQVNFTLNDQVMNLHMPSLKYPLEGKDNRGIREIIGEKAMNLFPVLGFVEAKSGYEPEVENNSTYEMILAQEAGDENAVDENGKLIAGEEMEKENQKAKAESGAGQAAEASAKKLELSLDKLKDFDYLKSHFYIVDQSTTINSSQLNVEKLLAKNMKIKNTDGPQILIYHTHSQEGYKDSKPGKESDTVVGVGDYLKDILEKKYGFKVLHHKGQYDLVNGRVDRTQAYTRAMGPVQKILKDHPSVQVVIDLHRDGVAEGTRLVTKVNGKKTAQFMFFNGLSRTTSQGNISYLANPYIQDNLALSLQMKLKAEEYYPGLTRKTYLKGYRYNLHLKPKSMLVEVGAQTNTVQEAKNAMEPLADMLNKVLHGK